MWLLQRPSRHTWALNFCFVLFSYVCLSSPLPIRTWWTNLQQLWIELSVYQGSPQTAVWLWEVVNGKILKSQWKLAHLGCTLPIFFFKLSKVWLRELFLSRYSPSHSTLIFPILSPAGIRSFAERVQWLANEHIQYAVVCFLGPGYRSSNMG